MGKLFKSKRSVVPAPEGVDIAGLMDKIQQQLDSLERKLDTLISQSSGRPSARPFRDRSFGGGRSYGRDRGRRDDNFRERSMTKVICAECGNECEVPFKPTADRPVYCRECFAKRKGGGAFTEKHDDGSSGENQEFNPKKKTFRRKK